MARYYTTPFVRWQLQSDPQYLTKDLHLFGQVLRSEMKEKMKTRDTEQRSGNDNKEIREKKAKEIGKISEDLLKKLDTALYFICVAYHEEVLATAQASGTLPSAKDLCDKKTIRDHYFLPDDQQTNYFFVSARKSENQKLENPNIPPTLHSVSDKDGFQLWIVKKLQPHQESPTYHFVKNYLLHAVLIFGAMGLLAYAWGRFVRRESRSKSDSGEKASPEPRDTLRPSRKGRPR